jgi:hypothetical protein
MTHPQPVIVAPVVHINGSGKEGLSEGYRKAWEALDKAHKAVCETAPHMRDYYVLQDGAETFHKAQDHHLVRLAALEALKADYEALWSAVFDQ